MSTYINEERELLEILKGSGLSEKKAVKLLRETREISPSTGAQMLAPFGVPYDRAFQYLNSAPPFADRPSTVNVRRIVGLVLVIITLVNIVVLILGKRDGGVIIRVIVFGSLARYFLRDTGKR